MAAGNNEGGTRERHCPFCRRPVSTADVCTHCRKQLVFEPRPRWQAGILSYLFGGLMGAIALFVVKVIELALGVQWRAVEMIVFGVVAVGSWTAKREQLSNRRDRAILLPRSEDSAEDGP